MVADAAAAPSVRSATTANRRRRVVGGVAGGAELFVAAENLFDRTYVVNVAGPLEYVGLPRTVRAGVAGRSF